MRYEKIPMSETDKNVFLEAYISDSIPDKKRKAILIFPGGGYAMICNDREGEPIALAFQHSFVRLHVQLSISRTMQSHTVLIPKSCSQ